MNYYIILYNIDNISYSDVVRAHSKEEALIIAKDYFPTESVITNLLDDNNNYMYEVKENNFII